jgi:hypothetical protein
LLFMLPISRATGYPGACADIVQTIEKRRCISDHPAPSFSTERDLVMSVMCEGQKVAEKAGLLALSLRSVGCRARIVWLMNTELSRTLPASQRSNMGRPTRPAS